MENTAFIKKIVKFIKIESNNEVSMQNFVDELRSMKIYEKLNENVNENPEDNCERFIHIMNNARKKHLQSKIVKYNKKKHKGSCCMTFGINNKNKLYIRFVQADKNNFALFNTLKTEYQLYRAVQD